MKRVFWICNIIIPIFVGAFIYIFVFNDAFIADWIQDYFRLDVQLVQNVDSVGMRLLRFYLADCLWSYALMFAVDLILNNVKYSLVISCIFASAVEMSQLIERVPGTFDIFDILVEICAILVAYFIIKLHRQI